MDIIKNYKSPTFGFASKNFYAEFLAALYVEQNYDRFFKDVKFAEQYKTGIVETRQEISLSELESLVELPRDEIRYFNPALTKVFFVGAQALPKGAKIRLPYRKFKKMIDKSEYVKNINQYVRFVI